ncbi:hypothetical protein KSF_054840 [Reticulibacter mediterranei]|uniref:Uncharacterized protein n=1 Tax=Reticulibacter mediterranei TaxID=2778369 RepID=A0A8J3IUD0_9CHLR|nr:hypothetical protein [Reticulibacter mediterranei]GHO95436.1 hypothetical protein KSF_054840 [Reticulibacter mediterranei]
MGKEQMMWALIRIRLNVAEIDLDCCGECSPFVNVWAEIGRTLVACDWTCLMTREHMQDIWDALVEAEYPGFQVADRVLFEEYWQAMRGGGHAQVV